MLAKAYSWVENLHRVDREIALIISEAEEILSSRHEMATVNLLIGCMRYLRHHGQMNEKTFGVADIAKYCTNIIGKEAAMAIIMATFPKLPENEILRLKMALAA